MSGFKFECRTSSGDQSDSLRVALFFFFFFFLSFFEGEGGSQVAKTCTESAICSVLPCWLQLSEGSDGLVFCIGKLRWRIKI